MPQYTVAVWVNVDPDFHFEEIRPGQQIARVDDFTVVADNHQDAAEATWSVGNKQGPDAAGKAYPLDVRSLSVGDLVTVDGGTEDPGVRTFAVASVGFTEIVEPAYRIVPLAGTKATSRTE